jgi:large subunit ribosomal protein L29
MAKSEVNELQELSIDELVARLAQAKDDAFKLRFRNATGQLENTAEIGAARKRIARINTVLRAKEIAAAEPAGAGKKVK